LNYDIKATGKKCLLDIHSLDGLRNKAYESSRIFKEKVKRWHDREIENKEKIRSKWEGPYEVEES
jgi:hypothetical protein